MTDPTVSTSSDAESLELAICADCRATVSGEMLDTPREDRAPWHASGEYGIATVVSHMACEVAIERRLSRAVDAKLDAETCEAILSMFNGYGLNADKQRSLYAALTGHLIQREHFWQDYKDSVRRRNSVVHGKQVATVTDSA